MPDKLKVYHKFKLMIDWLSIYNLLIIGVYINISVVGISTVCSISIAEEMNILQVCNE